MESVWEQATNNVGLPPAAEAYCRALALEVEILAERRERERCAKIAESQLCACKEEDLHDGCCGICGTRIAAVIRKVP